LREVICGMTKAGDAKVAPNSHELPPVFANEVETLRAA